MGHANNQLVQLSDLHQTFSVCDITLEWNEDSSDGGISDIEVVKQQTGIYKNVGTGSGGVKVYQGDNIIVRFKYNN